MAIVTKIITLNDETGEILSEHEYSEDYRIKAVHKNTIQAFKEKKSRMDIHEGKRYTKVYCEDWGEYLKGKDVTDGEARMALACILKSYKYGGMELSYRNNVPLNANDLIEAAGMTERSGFRAISNLVKHGILAREREGRGSRYYINPYLVFAGTKSEPGTEERFKDTKWATKSEKE